MRTNFRWVRSSLFAASFVVPLAVAALAQAESKCGEQTCPKNWECKQATATDGVACAPGEKCAEAVPTTFEYCAPLACSNDADCAADMVCYTETEQACPDAPPCAAGADCIAPADGACTAVTRSACVPRYVPPCESADDCGAGFTCEAAGCGCSAGSSGTGGSNPADPGSGGSEPAPSDGGAAPQDLVAPDCGCPADPEKNCRLTVTACSADGDCPSGFTCEENPQTSCSQSSDGQSSCEPATPARLCAPPYTELVGGVGAGIGEDASGTPTHANDPKGGATDEGSNAATTDPDAAAHESTSDGCSVTRAPRQGAGAFGLAALAALGAMGAFGVRRKRAR
jgi:hypothetical protein